MDSQQQFEGNSLEAVLRDVQATFGPNATIVEANRVRKGGIGGFFAREVFEVLAKPGRQQPRSTALYGDDSMPKSVLDLAERVNDTEAVTTPRISTQSKDFASVLANLAHNTEGPITDDEVTEFPGWNMETGTPIDGTILGDRRAPTLSTTNDGLEYHPADVNSARHVIHPNDTSEKPTTEDLVAQAREVAMRVAASRKQEAENAARAAQAAKKSMVQEVESPVVTYEPTSESKTEVELNEPPIARTPTVKTTTNADTMDAPLAALGLPADLIPPAIPGRDVRADLIERLERLPKPTALPTGNGSVIAVIGDRVSATVTAGRLAEELGLPAADIVVASPLAIEGTPPWLQVATPDEAAARRRNWWRRPSTTIVVVDAPMSPETTQWAVDMVVAMEPTAVWAAIDASKKIEDVERWTTRIGGIDAVALENLRATMSPASILRTGLPVARIDGRVADPQAWADLFAERLVEVA